MNFAKWTFRVAAIYGFIVLTPLYFAEPQIAAQGGPVNHPEFLYGFTGCALAFQLLFFLISRDPARLRPAMIACMAEKLSFPIVVWPLYLQCRTPVTIVVFSTIDLMWMVLFAVSWVRTREAA